MKPMIRWMISKDKERVLKIEQRSFLHFYNERELSRLLNLRSCIGMIIEDEDYVIGYVIYSLVKKGMVLNRIAIDPAKRRKGFGSKLIEKLCNKLCVTRRHFIKIIVSESDLTALVFLRSQGFVAIKTYKNYLDTDEDAYLMLYSISKSSKKIDRDEIEA